MVTSLRSFVQPTDLPTVFYARVLISFYMCHIDFCTSHLNQAPNGSALTVIENKFPIFPTHIDQIQTHRYTHIHRYIRDSRKTAKYICYFVFAVAAVEVLFVYFFIYLLVLMRCRATCHICRTLSEWQSVCVILAAKRVMASFKIGHNRNEKQ